jgi:hypothetical protein
VVVVVVVAGLGAYLYKRRQAPQETTKPT